MKFKLNLLFLVISLFGLSKQVVLTITEDSFCENVILFTINESSNPNTLWWEYDIRDIKKKIDEEYEIDTESLILRSTGFYTINKEIKSTTNTSTIYTNSLEITFNKTDDSTKKIKFITKAGLDNTVTKATTIENLVKSLTEPGTGGMLAYEESGILNIVLTKTEIKVDENLITPLEEAASTTIYKDSNLYWFNCMVNDEDNLNDYLYDVITYNYAFWLFVFFYFGFFLISVFLYENMEAFDFKENPWTYHPVYSIRYFVSDIYSKRMRLAQLFIEINSITFFLALFTYFFRDQNLAIRLIVFPILSIIFALFPTYFGGFLANRYYNCYRTYASKVKATEDFDQKLTALEEFESSTFRTEYLYYCFCALFGFGVNTASIFLMMNVLSVEYGWWFLSIAIAIIINLCILDILVVILAKKGVLTKLFKVRGFYFDINLQNNYNDVIGED